MTSRSTLLAVLATLVLTPACQRGAAAPAAPAEPPAAPAPAPPESPTPVASSPPSATTAAAAPAPAEDTEALPVASATPAPGKEEAPPPPVLVPAPASPPAAHGAAARPATPAPGVTGSASPAPVADACETKKFHFSQVASACRAGGRKAAKDVMRGAIKKAKAAGTDLQCTSCHQDTRSYQLKSNAVGDLKSWL